MSNKLVPLQADRNLRIQLGRCYSALPVPGKGLPCPVVITVGHRCLRNLRVSPSVFQGSNSCLRHAYITLNSSVYIFYSSAVSFRVVDMPESTSLETTIDAAQDGRSTYGISVQAFLASLTVSALLCVIQILAFIFLRDRLKHL